MTATARPWIFVDPQSYALRRPIAADHLASGSASISCLGAHLARMELMAFPDELLPRLGHFELAAEPEYTTTTFVGGRKRMPIRCRLR